MKVAYINPTRLVRRPLAELSSRFKDSAVLIPRPIFKPHKNPWHNKLKCKVYSYPSLNIPFIQFDWSIPLSPYFFVQIWRIFRDYDVVHLWTFFYISSWACMLFKKFFKKTKLIMCCDTLPGLSFKSGFFVDLIFKIYYKLFGWTFRIPDVIHVYTDEMGKLLYDKVIKKYYKLRVIPPGVDIEKFNKVERSKLNHLPIVTYAGIVCKRKGIDRLLEIESNYTLPFLFYIYGKGPDYEKHRKYYIGKYSSVIFHGWSTNLPQDLKDSDICILLSKGEGIPGIVMEAMASKLPVIATDIDGNRELVKHEVTGFLVKTDEDIVNALMKLRNPELRKKMGEEGYNQIQQYEWDKLIPKYEEMYNEKRQIN